MNINFEYYKIFYYVATNGNITQTANKLLISQPAVSKSIKNLEEQLGCLLFTRNKTGVILTEEGKVLYNEIKVAIELMDNAKNKIDDMINLETGILNIGVNNTLNQKYLIPFIKQFTKMYPKITIKIFTGTSNQFISYARNGLIDIIILHLPYEVPNDFEIINLKETHTAFFASNDFKELKNIKVPLKDMNNYPLVFLAQGSNSRKQLDCLCAKKQITLNPKYELSSYTSVSEYIKSGLAIGILTKEFIEEEIKNNILFEINTDIKLESRNICAIYSKVKPLNRATKEFLKLLNNSNIKHN